VPAFLRLRALVTVLSFLAQPAPEPSPLPAEPPRTRHTAADEEPARDDAEATVQPGVQPGSSTGPTVQPAHSVEDEAFAGLRLPCEPCGCTDAVAEATPEAREAAGGAVAPALLSPGTNGPPPTALQELRDLSREAKSCGTLRSSLAAMASIYARVASEMGLARQAGQREAGQPGDDNAPGCVFAVFQSEALVWLPEEEEEPAAGPEGMVTGRFHRCAATAHCGAARQVHARMLPSTGLACGAEPPSHIMLPVLFVARSCADVVHSDPSGVLDGLRGLARVAAAQPGAKALCASVPCCLPRAYVAGGGAADLFAALRAAEPAAVAVAPAGVAPMLVPVPDANAIDLELDSSSGDEAEDPLCRPPLQRKPPLAAYLSCLELCAQLDGMNVATPSSGAASPRHLAERLLSYLATHDSDPVSVSAVRHALSARPLLPCLSGQWRRLAQEGPCLFASDLHECAAALAAVASAAVDCVRLPSEQAVGAGWLVAVGATAQWLEALGVPPLSRHLRWGYEGGGRPLVCWHGLHWRAAVPPALVPCACSVSIQAPPAEPHATAALDAAARRALAGARPHVCAAAPPAAAEDMQRRVAGVLAGAFRLELRHAQPTSDDGFTHVMMSWGFPTRPIFVPASRAQGPRGDLAVGGPGGVVPARAAVLRGDIARGHAVRWRALRARPQGRRRAVRSRHGGGAVPVRWGGRPQHLEELLAGHVFGLRGRLCHGLYLGSHFTLFLHGWLPAARQAVHGLLDVALVGHRAARPPRGG
jgi:hypothetical protein